MAGAVHGGALADAVADSTEPWIRFTEETVERFVGSRPFGVIDASQVAVAVVALFVGLELLDNLDPVRFDTTGLLAGAAQFLAMFPGQPAPPPDG